MTRDPPPVHPPGRPLLPAAVAWWLRAVLWWVPS